MGDGRVANNAATSGAKGGGANGSGGGGHGADELSIFVKGSNGAVIRKTPLHHNTGQPMKGESRRLIATLSGCDKAGFKELIGLLERVEDLGHVLLWSV